MQKAYIEALYEIMQEDSRVYSLLSDSGTDYDVLMARDMPNQCINLGIAEQNQVGVAAGMAKMGKIPFVYTTGAFIAYRAYEFVRNDVCFQNRNVKLMGMGMGMGSWSTLGASHHTTEDIAVLRVLPNLTLLSASTPIQLKKMVRAAYEIDGPVYVRIGMSGEEEFYSDDYVYRVDQIDRLINGNDYIVFATGTIMGEAYRAVARLNDDAISTGLVDVHTIKPLEANGILEAIKDSKIVFTVEEHNIIGGLGSAIAEVLASQSAAAPLCRIGLYDKFAEGYGRTHEVRKMNGLDADEIYNSMLRRIQDEQR